MFKNMKLSMRIGLGYTIILVLMIAIMMVVFISMNSIQSKLDKIVGVNAKKLTLSQNMSSYIAEYTLGTRDMIFLSDQSSKEELQRKLDEIRAGYNTASQELEKLPADAMELTIRGRINDALEVGRPLNTKVAELAMAEQNEEATTILLNESAPAQQKWRDALAENVKYQEDTNDRDAEEAARAYSSTLVIIIALGAVSLILGIFTAVTVTRSITVPVNLIVSNLTEGAQQVASASEQLSASSQQLAGGNAEQASSIEETSSTLEESASMIQQNSENTRQAAILAAQAKTSSDKGNAEMQEMMNSIIEIKKSSDQIAKIIKVIDDIAFQTNILALNAAVEAARAGEAGMGFAVVAEEVRNLAQRSAQAAKDTAAIIEGNIELSEKGVNVARRVGEALSEITVQSKKVNELMDEIAAASQEQAQGIAQINQAISQMDTVTQQNAATSEESASASEELSAQAESLREIVTQLEQLVSGSSSSSELSASYTLRSHSETNVRKAAGRPSTHGSFTPARPSVKTAVQKNSGKRTYIVKPEEVIPLQDDLKGF